MGLCFWGGTKIGHGVSTNTYQRGCKQAYIRGLNNGADAVFGRLLHNTPINLQTLTSNAENAWKVDQK
jgi:hypothetical protein